MRLFRKKYWWWILIPIITLLCLFLLLSYYYPLSFLSINQQYEFTPEPVITDQYEQSLDHLKGNRSEMKTNDLTVIRVQQGLGDVYFQDLLTSEESVVFNKDTLLSIQQEVVETRKWMLDLATSEEYDETTKNYLWVLLSHLIYMESRLQKIALTSDTYSREEWDQVLDELHIHFDTSLEHFNTFYDSHIDRSNP
ncbi:hypothetical protein [Gracilibacillus phocaeensis]|uniref:hypothetical protein n=1 Tax=Gracilibacillus phocaeensis TaxID=2042304 RepID=UPI001031064F|nr:hypothetical protein [Gracilibacillus phocaeensis]